VRIPAATSCAAFRKRAISFLRSLLQEGTTAPGHRVDGMTGLTIITW
jgi:hypothetical protein